MTIAELVEALGLRQALPPVAPGAEPAPEALSARTVEGVASLLTASPTSVLFAESEEALEAAVQTVAAAVFTSPALAEALPPHPGARPAVLPVAQPRLAFARAAQLLAGAARQSREAPYVHPTALVSPSARVDRTASLGPLVVVEARATVGAHTTIASHAVLGAGVRLGEGCTVGAGAVLGPGVTVGENTRIHPRAVLYPGITVGARCVIHAGAVLGADGFGFVRDRDTGAYTPFPQQGTLVLEDEVEVGANATVDRGALEETRIGRGTKLDNLVHVGHNVRVGADVVVAAQTGISGSSTVGDGAVIGGQVGIADHVEIGPGVIVGAQSGVPSKKRLHGPGVVFWGTPARPIAGYLKELATLARLTRGSRKSAGERS